MGLDDKMDNHADKAKGKVKEGSGKLTDDKSQENEGKMDQTKADLKNAAEKVKDAFKN